MSEKRILGISYRLLCDLLSVLDETCSGLEHQGKIGTEEWLRVRTYKFVVQRVMEESTNVYNGKNIELASLELRYLFVLKENLLSIRNRIEKALKAKRLKEAGVKK